MKTYLEHVKEELETPIDGKQWEVCDWSEVEMAYSIGGIFCKCFEDSDGDIELPHGLIPCHVRDLIQFIPVREKKRKPMVLGFEWKHITGQSAADICSGLDSIGVTRSDIEGRRFKVTMIEII